MRGKAKAPDDAQNKRRITPAHAGKRERLSRIWELAQDHPRACGEKVSACVDSFLILGSPPRMRGKGFLCNPNQAPSGITPAHAGKSQKLLLKFEKKQDHPRACGEKARRSRALCLTSGSPPRMRGKEDLAEEEAKGKGITPAHAGKSIAPILHLGAFTGSPPRMRGKVNPITADKMIDRITPAHAGKSTASVGSHACELGSPPRMRGKDCRRLFDFLALRITPAHAGKRVHQVFKNFF